MSLTWFHCFLSQIWVKPHLNICPLKSYSFIHNLHVIWITICMKVKYFIYKIYIITVILLLSGSYFTQQQKISSPSEFVLSSVSSITHHCCLVLSFSSSISHLCRLVLPSFSSITRHCRLVLSSFFSVTHYYRLVVTVYFFYNIF